MADIFISYARQDRESAERLARALERDGLTVWWDIEALRSGQSFNRAIQHALEAATCVVVLWSDTSINSPYVEAEAYWAWEHEKLHSVRLDDGIRVPVPFNTVHSRSLGRWREGHDDSELQRLKADLRAAGAAMPQTAAAGKPEHCGHPSTSHFTWVSVIETIFAVAIIFGSAAYYHTGIYIALLSSLAPLVLLRSEASERQGRKLFGVVEAGSREAKTLLDQPTLVPMGSVAHLFLNIPVLCVSALLIRVYATLRHLPAGFLELPQNWRRVIFETDFRTSLEFVPGSGSVASTLRHTDVIVGIVLHHRSLRVTILSLLTLAAVIVFFSDGSDASVLLLAIALALGSLLAMAYYPQVFSYLYRFALKATAIVWLPLVFLLPTRNDESWPIESRISEIRGSASWKLMRGVAWLTITVIVAKVSMLPLLGSWWDGAAIPRLLNAYLMIYPPILDSWHIASFLNATLTLTAFYFFIDKSYYYLPIGRWQPGQVQVGLRAFLVIRAVLAFYTIIAALMITWNIATDTNWHLFQLQWSGRFLPDLSAVSIGKSYDFG